MPENDVVLKTVEGQWVALAGRSDITRVYARTLPRTSRWVFQLVDSEGLAATPTTLALYHDEHEGNVDMEMGVPQDGRRASPST